MSGSPSQGPTQPLDFPLSWGRLVWGMSIIACTIFVLVVLSVQWSTAQEGYEAQWVYGKWGTYGVIGLIVGICVLYAPLRYRVTPAYVEVVRLAPNWRIPRDAIAAAGRVDVTRSWRVFGNGGLFGFSGWYRNSELRTYYAAYTRRENTIVLWREEGDIPVVLSPDDPEAFLAALNVPESVA